MSRETITIEKAFKHVTCGYVESIKDKHGNEKFLADRIVDGDKFEFWNRGAAEHWLRLGGLLYG